MRKILWMVGIFLNSFAFSQVSEGFNDGELLHQPEWIGDTGRFIVNANKQLQSKLYPKSDTAFLATSNEYILNTVWEFYLQINVDPSTSNQLRIHLTSDKLSLDSLGNGYFLQVGETGANDSYDLYKKSGKSITKIIDGLPKSRERIDTLRAYIMIVHRTDGYWEVFSRSNHTASWTSEGFCYDRTFLKSLYMGVSLRHTSTRTDKFILDQISVYPYEVDSLLPEISKAEVMDERTIRLTCSKEIDTTSFTDINSIKLNDRNASRIEFQTSSLTQFNVYFQENIPVGNSILEVPVFKDIIGNTSSNIQNISIHYIPEIPLNKHSVFISEIMPDPSPAIDLPDVEYVELYNASDRDINLENWEYQCSNTKTKLPKHILKKNEFVILCKASDTSIMLLYGNCIGLKTWPTLVNSGAQLKLLEPKGKIIDEIHYETSWYKNNTKTNGGYSLEYIFPNKICEGIYAWQASGSERGGTPAKPNYNWEFPNDALYVQQVEMLKDGNIFIRFNKTPDTSTSNLRSNYFIENLHLIPSKVIFANAEKNELYLKFDTEFVHKNLYGISLKNIFTCNKETLQENEFKVVYMNNDDTSKIRINEIYVDPFPSMGLAEAEYIELYNASENTIDLAGYSFVIGSTKYILPRYILRENEYVIICSANDTNSLKVYGKVIGINGMLSLSNTVSSLTLTNKVDRIIDRITYRQSWYRDQTKIDGGWSIELVDPYNKCDFINKWSASVNVKGGTPGQVNSIADFNIDKRDLGIASFKNINGMQFKITLNKAIDGRSINPAQLYFVGPQMKLYFPQKVQIDSPYYKIFTITFNKAMPVGKYNLICQYLPSCSRADTNIIYPVYLNYVSSSIADIMFSEIMPDPSPSVTLPEAEYIELYNSSDKDLYDLRLYLSDLKDSIPIYIDEWKANTYMIFCHKEFRNSWDKGLQVYPLNKMLSLGNESDSLFILDEHYKIIKSLSYSIDQFPPNKKEGGYSLTKIKGTWDCESTSTWQVSLNENGGSPGKENNDITEYEITPISLKNIVFTENNQLKLMFSPNIEKNAEVELRLADKKDKLSYTIHEDYIELKLPVEIKSGEMKKLEVQLTNCLGMHIDTTVIIHNTYIPKPGELLINEILFNPLVGGVDFIEVYNNSDSVINLRDIILSDSKTKVNLASSLVIENEYNFIMPKELRVFTINKEDIFGKYQVAKAECLIELSKMPSMNDDEGTIMILNNKNEIIDQLDYAENFHISWIKDTEGRSLERKRMSTSTNEKDNWSSATDDIGKASPTGKNSQYNSSTESKALAFWLSKEVLYPNKNNTDNILEINYKVESVTAFIKVKVFDINGLYVGEITNEKSIRNDGLITWDFSTEGQRISSGTYILAIECYSENGVQQYYKIPFVLHY